jgi:hypothetical protein
MFIFIIKGIKIVYRNLKQKILFYNNFLFNKIFSFLNRDKKLAFKLKNVYILYYT